MTNLTITNYDNFKDLSYFVGQHEKALGIMNEVNDFYLSFLKSKLICNYEIDVFPGKVIIERFRDLIEKCVSSDYNSEYKNIVEGARLRDNNGYWYTVTNVKENKDRYNDYYHKHYYKKYDIKRPYYVSAFQDIHCWYWSSEDNEIEKLKEELARYQKRLGQDVIYLKPKTGNVYCLNDKIKEHEERSKLNKQQSKDYEELESLLTPENYKNQNLYKKKLKEYFLKYYDKAYYTIDSKTGKIQKFAFDSELKEYSFKISDDKQYLIVYNETQNGGTRTKNWQTFEYKGIDHDEIWFEISTGNFFEHKKYFVKTYEREMDVYNGWSPYD